MTEVYQSLASSIYLSLLITGKNQLLTALPCWNGLTHSSSRTSPLSPPARTCLFYLKTLSSIFQIKSGTHLLSHAVSSIVPSAAYVLTVVFGMGTGVSHKRIDTRIIRLSCPPAVLCKQSYGAALPKPFRKARQYSLSSIQSQENKFSCSFLSAILCRLP
mgnify:FL=1